MYLYAFVEPATGSTYWLILPEVTGETMTLALKEFACHLGAGPDHHVLLIVDRAGFHTGDTVSVPEGIHLEFLPSHTPELQPAEKLWSLSDEPLVDKCFATLDDIMDVLEIRCRVLRDMKETIKGRCNFHWLPQGGGHAN